MKRRGWTKERLEKFRATMKRKRNGIENQAVVPAPPELTMVERWNFEADEFFTSLPLEKKITLLSQVKP